MILLSAASCPATSASASAGTDKQRGQGVPKLERGKPIDRELIGDQAHSYSIILRAGQYLHIVVDQRGIDVVATLFAPDQKTLAEVDSPNGTEGPEPLSFVAEDSGSYRLQVRSPEKAAAAGRYQVRIDELRPATAQDKSRIAAEDAFKQAEVLHGQGAAETLRGAIAKYQESLPLFRTAGDRGGEALAHNGLGLAYSSLGEKQ